MSEFPEPDVMCDCGGNYYTAEQVRAAILAERERSALVCEELVALGEDGTREDRYAATAIACAAAIRRG